MKKEDLATKELKTFQTDDMMIIKLMTKGAL